MTTWSQRSQEEQRLLNPSFCATLLWHAARGYSAYGNKRLSLEEAFLVLPFTLHRKTRESLPRDIRTSLAVWLDDNPLARGTITSRARLLITFTKEGLLFGGMHGFLEVWEGQLHANKNWQRLINRSLRLSSDEVRDCVKRANFLGKWFAQTGSALTVFALVGVRP